LLGISQKPADAFFLGVSFFSYPLRLQPFFLCGGGKPDKTYLCLTEMPTNKLHTTEPFEGITIMFSCAEKDFRTAWALNRVLQIQLRQTEEIATAQKGQNDLILFGCFEFDDEKNFRKWRLVNNRVPAGILEPDYKNLDYLLIGFGEFDFLQTEEIIRRMRSVRFITAAYSVPSETIRLKGLLMM
jgi:hypothetical protein